MHRQHKTRLVDLYERPVERVRREKENSTEGKTEEEEIHILSVDIFIVRANDLNDVIHLY
jgi:hypothetical protein